jgi:subtilisin family serine protease
MRVMLQLRPASPLRLALEASLDAAAPQLPTGFAIDPDFEPAAIPTPHATEEGADPFSLAVPRTFATGEQEVTHIVRGTIPDGPEGARAVAAATANPEVVGVFADPAIETCLTCGGDPPLGTNRDVARLLGVGDLAAKGLDGRNVTLAIVDTGVNLDYLRAQGQNPTFNSRKSWRPHGVPTKPGEHPVNHGTMCAYDAGITAPAATLVDYAVLLSQQQTTPVMAGLLSDAVLAFSKLMKLAGAMPASRRALVVSNSWGIFRQDMDFPVGHPGNYSDNPRHPFNVIVASLDDAGADILFAAGNCGRECPDGRCAFGSARSICGANSHPNVLSVGGMDTKGKRVGYSSQGPGRLSEQKPDVLAYTHYKGSQVFKPEADSGTSAACPTLAGLVAAVRSGWSAGTVSPAQLRALVRKTAKDVGRMGFDFDNGFGTVDAAALVAALQQSSVTARATGRSRRRRTPAGRARRRKATA